MRILYIVTTLNKVGPIEVIYNILRYKMKEHEISIFTVKKSSENSFIKILENECNIIEFKNIYQITKYLLLNKEDYDVIHCAGLQPNIVNVIIKCFYKNSLKVSNCVSVEKDDFIRSRGLFKGTIGYKLNLFLYKRMDIVFAGSNAIKKYLINNKIKNVYKIFYGIELDEIEYSKCLKKNNDSLIQFIQLGKVTENKNQFFSIKLIHFLIEKGINAKLIIIGDISDSKYVSHCKSYITENNLHKNIEFTGYISIHSKKILLKYSDIMIMPSYTEGLPLSVIEGYQYKLPVICSNKGGLPEVVKNNYTGLVLDITSNDNYFIIYEYLISKRYIVHSNNVFKFAKNKFSANQMSNNYFNTYERFLKNEAN